jgi:hypothetical protein
MKVMPVLVTVLAFCFTVSSCEPSLKVTSDYDKSANFTQFKTFKMNLSDEAHQSISSLNRDRVINAVKAEMLKEILWKAMTILT